MNTPLIEMRHISKSFGGVHAVEDVSIDLYPGEVLGLLGHNGAGKSTLIKILSGAYTADEGDILVSGKTATIRNPKDAKKNGGFFRSRRSFFEAFAFRLKNRSVRRTG